MRHTAIAKIKRMLQDRAGNVAIMTALCALPLFGMMGLAIDYALALSNKSRLDAAADAAVIAAITKAKSAINGGATQSAGIAQGQAQGIAAFKANAGALPFATVPTPNVTISQSGQTLTAQLTYSTTSHNQFGRLFNVATTTIGGNSTSNSILTPYYQFIFVVDISGSMSIGGTTQDINGLVADPKIQCAFACHDPYHNRLSTDYRVVAKQDGWTLKIDYVNQAIQTFINGLKTQTANISGVFSVGIDTFATNFTVLQTPTTNFTTALAAAAQVDIEPMAPLWYSQGYTRTTSSLSSALAQLNNIGNGTSAAQQTTYIIFLSDGVEDIEGSMIYGRGTDVSYTSACTTIKNAGATLISIVAPYPVIPTNQDPDDQDPDDQYAILIAPLAPKLSPAMQNCASGSTWAYQATDGPGINAAVQAALQQILQGMTRIIQ